MSLVIGTQGTNSGAPLAAQWVLVGIGLMVSVTMAAPVEPAVIRPYGVGTSIPVPDRVVAEPAQTSQSAIQEIRKRSGLTWKEIASIFGVSARAVHLWAGGENVSSAHEAQILAILEKLRSIDQGSVQATASRLRSSQGDVPLFTVLGELSISALNALNAAKVPHSVVDQEILIANWRPVAPFRDRWDDEPVGEVVPVGNYPSKRLKVASKRLG